MLYGIDSAYPPTLSAARRYFSYGWRFYGGYIGGPRAAHTWSNEDFGQLAGVGFTFIPIYVGRNYPWDTEFTYARGIADGDDANNNAGRCGFNESQPLCLDIEYGTFQNWGQALLDYADGWCRRVHDAGHKTIVYTDQGSMLTVGDHFDYKWGADWIGNAGHYSTPPWGRYNPAEPPPWDLWQFADNGIGGVVDLNSAVDGFPLAVYTPPV